jgi:hypothetical protein
MNTSIGRRDSSNRRIEGGAASITRAPRVRILKGEAELRSALDRAAMCERAISLRIAKRIGELLLPASEEPIRLVAQGRAESGMAHWRVIAWDLDIGERSGMCLLTGGLSCEVP